MSAAVARFGRIDVLVNNAGNFYAGYFENISPEQFRAQMETNFFGPLNVTRAVLPVMREQRSGQVITITSAAGLMGQEFCSAYAASKFALEGWMESLRYEVEPFGIATMIVEPGFFRTELLVEGSSTIWPELDVEDYAERTAQTIEAWKQMNGQQGGDPSKLAAALVTLSDGPELPLRFVAGADVMDGAEQNLRHHPVPDRRAPRTVRLARLRRLKPANPHPQQLSELEHPNMKYRTLPGTGISVSNLALGAMGFGTETDEAESFAILDRFVEADGNLVDTANVYGGGVSEEVIGRWFANRPADITDRVVLATKARYGTGPDVNEVGSSRRNLDRALNASLRRLGLDNIDLYQLHGWDPLTPIEVTLGFLDDAVRAGKINHIGLSNFTGWQLQLAVSTARAMNLNVPVTLQPQYSLVSREIEFEIIPAAMHNNLGLLPWSPLATGFLSGKIHKDQPASDDTRAGSGGPMYDHIFANLAAKDQNWATLDTVRDVAEKLGITPSQVAYSWVTNRPGVTAPIIGARTVEQLEQNLAAADIELDDESTKRLDDVSAPTPNDYPYGPFGAKQRDRYIHSSDQAISELF